MIGIVIYFICAIVSVVFAFIGSNQNEIAQWAAISTFYLHICSIEIDKYKERKNKNKNDTKN